MVCTQKRCVSKSAAAVLLEMIASTILIEVAAPLSFTARIFPETKLFLGDDSDYGNLMFMKVTMLIKEHNVNARICFLE